MSAPVRCAHYGLRVAAWRVDVRDVVYLHRVLREARHGAARGDRRGQGSAGTYAMSDPAEMLADVVAALGEDERRVLLVLARRLLAGQTV